MSESPLKKIRTLSIALFLSVVVNVCLLLMVIFWSFYQRPEALPFASKPKKKIMAKIAASQSNTLLLQAYKNEKFEQLVQKLSQSKLVEDGFRERDLSLAILAGFHYFDLEKGLNTHESLLQKRVLTFGNPPESIFLYPGLSDEHFAALIQFAKKERWPFKPQGLFLLLKSQNYTEDPTLLDAFTMSEEFLELERIFKSKQVGKEELLKLAEEGEFGLLSALLERRKALQEYTDEYRQGVLLSYLKGGSKTAAHLLITNDFDFATKKVSDKTILDMIGLLEIDSANTLKFLNSLAVSPRSDMVRTKASAKYTELTGKKIEPLVSRQVVVASKPQAIEKALPYQKPAPLSLPSKTPAKPAAKVTALPKKPADTLYIVQEKDSLWKISKRFQVSVDKIKAHNQLKSENLKPGTPLRIPAKQ